MKPFMCVGLAYFLVAVVLPAVLLSSKGTLTTGWKVGGFTWGTLAGVAGALGALGIILAFDSGGKDIYVMPLVFGGAPLVNVFVSMRFQGLSVRDMGGRLPFFLAGVIMVAVGAAMVLVCRPRPATGGHGPPAPSPPAAVQTVPAEPRTNPPAVTGNESSAEAESDAEENV
jgi:hypothetical protein